MAQELFFLALIPSPEIQRVATQLTQFCAQHFNTKKALNSPPHVTLHAPFKWQTSAYQQLIEHLQLFAEKHSPVPMIFDGMNCFKPRVIYIDVQQTPGLIEIQTSLKDSLQQIGIEDKRYGHRAFCPHLTIAFKDLSKTNFYRAWSAFNSPDNELYQARSLYFECVVYHLTLLRHDGIRWHIDQAFPFAPNYPI